MILQILSHRWIRATAFAKNNICASRNAACCVFGEAGAFTSFKNGRAQQSFNPYGNLNQLLQVPTCHDISHVHQVNIVYQVNQVFLPHPFLAASPSGQAKSPSGTEHLAAA